MHYFIVQAPYEKCFALFFRDELGYPNFYRMTELLPSLQAYSDLILLAPSSAYPHHDHSQKILQTLNTLGMPYHSFGHGSPTSFTFGLNGRCNIAELFEKNLSEAIHAFKNKT